MATPARIAAWLGALQALLPPGQAIAREAGAVATRLLEAIAARFADADAAAEDWTAQYDPSRATSMLPDWERLLGLPERCMLGVSLTLADRQRLAAQRLVELGGQSRAYFIEIARQLGEPGVTITEFSQFNVDSACTQALYSQADEFTWRVNIPRPAADVRLMTCENDCTSALQSYRPSLAECPITERKPAHTAVIFAYTG